MTQAEYSFCWYLIFSDYSGAVENDLHYDSTDIPLLANIASGNHNNTFTFNQNYSELYQTGNN